MKRIANLVLVVFMMVGMMFVFTACGGGDGGAGDGGKLVCGVTDYEPMNYKDNNGNWTGFDTEFALLVGEKLGMKVEFQQIEWINKYSELESGSINCIWNGFTANAYEEDGTPRSELVDLSYCYMLNQQSVVIKAARDREFRSIDSLKGKNVAAEKGSAGEAAAKEAMGDTGKMIDSASQTSTFIEVKSGAADCAVVDILLAQKLAGTGDFSDLKIADIKMDAEMYAVAFKQGSDLKDKVNQAMQELYDDGTLAELAEKYGLENSLKLETTLPTRG